MTRPSGFKEWKPGMKPADESALWYANMRAMERMEATRPVDPVKSERARKANAKRKAKTT